MSDIINIQVQETVENVEIVAQNNVIEVNITRQSGGGGGAVDSVFGRTGVVTAQNGDYNAGQITETGARVFVTPAEKTAITHANRSILDAITEAFTTALKTAYDSAVTWISTNGANLLNHLTSTSNPHNTTASQVGAYTTGQVDTLLNSKITQNDWVDISLTSTISGFSTITTRTIEYLVTGDECTLLANIQGTSNSGLLTFTLPFNYTGISNFIDVSARIVSNGVAQNAGGMVRIIAGTNLVEVFPNGNATGFATTGNKQTQLAIKFKIN